MTKSVKIFCLIDCLWIDRNTMILIQGRETQLAIVLEKNVFDE